MKNKILPTCLQGNYRNSLGELTITKCKILLALFLRGDYKMSLCSVNEPKFNRVVTFSPRKRMDPAEFCFTEIMYWG